MVQPSTRKPRILFDLSTSLQWRGQHAVGIVRTERELAVRLLNDPELDIVPVIFHDKNLRAIDLDSAMELVSPPRQTDKKTTTPDGMKPGIKDHITRFLKRFSKKIIRLGARVARFFVRLILKITPVSIHSEIRQCFSLFAQAMRKLIYKNNFLGNNIAAQGHVGENTTLDLNLVVHPSPDDILFLVGLGWDVIDCASLFSIKQNSGMTVATVIYDFIPTKFPQFLGGDPSDYFLNYFIHMVDISDFCFCISECTRRDFIEFCNIYKRDIPDTEVVYLGSSLIVQPDSSEITEELRLKLAKGRYALSVGTFEIRKNYGFLISVWEDLLKDPDFDLSLVIVGMPGWKVDELIEHLQASPYLGTRIIWFQNLSDAGLSWLYKNCQVFLFPSLYEGWGLPVVEALQYKRPAIISNRGSVPEAGLGIATVVDVDDRDAWIRAIRDYAVPERATLQQDISLPTWEETASVAKSRLVKLIEDKNEALVAGLPIVATEVAFRGYEKYSGHESVMIANDSTAFAESVRRQLDLATERTIVRDAEFDDLLWSNTLKPVAELAGELLSAP